MENPKIALFVGSDISSHLLINWLIPQFQSLEIDPVVYFPTTKKRKNNLPTEVQKLAFYERLLLKETIYQFLDNAAAGDNKVLSPNQLKTVYGIECEPVQNINDAAFIQKLLDIGVMGGISLRCYQKFGAAFIDTCLLYTSPSPRDRQKSRMPSSA